MIVVSMALTGVAIVLLVIGLAVSSGLGFIYASIAVSLLGILALGVGFARGRVSVGAPSPFGGEPTPNGQSRREGAQPDDADASGATDGGTEPPVAETDEVQPVAAFAPRPATSRSRSARTAASDGAVPASAVGTVLVVPGRPRYHVAGCRYLTGREAEERTAAEARESGFSACGVCRPDDVLSAQSAGEPSQPAAAELAAAEAAPEAPRRSATRPRRAAAATRGDENVRVIEPAGAESDAPAAEDQPTAAPAARRTATVVAVRTRYHRPECRFAGVAGAEPVSKATARRRGLTACGVCKP